ncbi:hypothetical protein HMPREF1531_01661 [Propionibacterium sp. oral taxon 192 str. F0372]|uniref:amino acid permease n=1 Tax=Propionibacterium sp. oral taxon 192 TaxID=671222 RepID=UPI000353AD9A|nr:amino acid permease [Propionibacterium sp. oral taxon 192]EPH02355.1 hypothetical protein HMPREF1531_01661 [Propionibacterium sp. oral taxon 192 str. F0372]
MSTTANNLESADDTAHPPTDEDHLKRNLSNRHIQLIALGGAIGTGLFMGSGKTIHIAGPSIMVVYLILGTVMFLVLRAMGEMLLHNLRYKSFMDFSHDLVGPWAGYFAGWTYWVLWVIIAVGDMIVVTGYFNHWVKNLHVSMMCTVVLLAALLVSNMLTVRLFGEIEFWFAIIKILAIVVLILVGTGMVVGGFTSPDGTQASFAHIWDHGGIFPMGVGGFLAAFPVAIYSFIGSELIGTTAAETQDPYKTIPKAINAVPVRIMIFYVLALAVIMAITPWDQVDPSQSPFVNVFSLVGLVAAASVMNFVVLTSASSSANSGIYSSSRMLFGLADQEQAHPTFKQLSSRHVPARALLLSGGIGFLFVPMLLIGGSVMEGFIFIADVAAMLILFMWSLIMVAYIKYYRNHREAHEKSIYKLPFPQVTPWVVLAFFAFILIVTAFQEGQLIKLALTSVWFVILFIGWQVQKRRRGIREFH